VSGEELLGLACEPEVAARLVTQHGKSYRLTPGPLDTRRVSRLGQRNWTVLVSDLEEHLPALASVLAHLDFLPSWRIDDLMASFAVPGGSVGPHFDSYDVFLIQVSGERLWQISKDYDPTELRTDSPLRLLNHFRPEQQWLCRPGDLLYLPPQVAHYGVAQTPCVTYSLGCRAPSLKELATHLAQSAIDALDPMAHYRDETATAGPSRHSLSSSAARTALESFKRAMDLSPEAATRAFASLVTQPKALFTRDSTRPLSARRVEQRLRNPNGLSRRKGSRWLQVPEQHLLFVDGEAFASPRDQLAESLCQASWFSAETVAAWCRSLEGAALLGALVRAGQLLPGRITLE
jgi:50S ribosomal protein L16 3-hydroxylase